MRLIIAVCVWCGLLTPVVAQNSPSAAETVTFLSGLLSCEGSKSYNFPAVESTVAEHGSARISADSFALTTERTIREWYKDTRKLETHRLRLRLVVPMAHFDPAAARNGTRVTVRCNPAHGKCIKESFVRVAEDGGTFDANDAEAKTERELLLCNEADAESFVKGWNHLITISGGKGRLF